MIEILRVGTKKQIECQECGALLRYEEGDIKTSEYYVGSSIPQYSQKYIICPQCNQKIILEAQR